MRFITLSIISQAIGFIAGVALKSLAQQLEIFPYQVLVLHSLVAFAAAYKFNLPKSWQLLNLLLPSTILLIVEFDIKNEFILVLALVLLLIYLPTFFTRVPYYPTSYLMYQEIAALLPKDRSFSFIDLGCGFGPLLSHLARQFPNGRFYGVEVGFMPYIISKIRALLSSGQINVQFKSIWSVDLKQFDYVYAFLAPPPMPRLWEKVKTEMQPGNTFLTNTFRVPDAPDKTIEVQDNRRCVLYVHNI